MSFVLPSTYFPLSLETLLLLFLTLLSFLFSHHRCFSGSPCCLLILLLVWYCLNLFLFVLVFDLDFVAAAPAAVVGCSSPLLPFFPSFLAFPSLFLLFPFLFFSFSLIFFSFVLLSFPFFPFSLLSLFSLFSFLCSLFSSFFSSKKV